MPCPLSWAFSSQMPLYANDCVIVVSCTPVRLKLGCTSRLGSLYISLVAPCFASFLALLYLPFSPSFISFLKWVVLPLLLSAAIMALKISLFWTTTYLVGSHLLESSSILFSAYADFVIIVCLFCGGSLIIAQRTATSSLS